MQDGWNTPRCTFLSFPFSPYVIFSLSLQKAPSVITEELSAPPADHAAARYIYTYTNEKWGLYYNHLVSSVAHLWFMRLTCLRLTGRWITLCACVWFCVCVCRTTWQAPCVTSVRPGSSTYQRPTPRAVCAVSVWASPSSAPAPLGIEIRQVAKLLMVKGGVNIFGIKVWVSVCAAALCQPILSDAERRGAACKQRSCSGGALTFEPRLASHSDNRLCLSGARRGERAALLPR